MRIQVLRCYEINTEMTPKEFIRHVMRSEYGEGLAPASLGNAAIAATYACDGGDWQDIITDEGSDDLITLIHGADGTVDNTDLNLTITWQDAWADGETWP